MSHARQQIREAVATLLTTEVTAVSGRVYPYRVIGHDILPDITVMNTEDLLLEEGRVKSDIETRVLTLALEIRAKELDDMDDVLDDLSVAVETAMMEDRTLGGKLKFLGYSSTTLDIEDGEDRTVGLATITYEAWYRIDRTDPETIVS